MHGVDQPRAWEMVHVVEAVLAAVAVEVEAAPRRESQWPLVQAGEMAAKP